MKKYCHYVKEKLNSIINEMENRPNLLSKIPAKISLEIGNYHSKLS